MDQDLYHLKIIFLLGEGMSGRCYLHDSCQRQILKRQHKSHHFYWERDSMPVRICYTPCIPVPFSFYLPTFLLSFFVHMHMNTHINYATEFKHLISSKIRAIFVVLTEMMCLFSTAAYRYQHLQPALSSHFAKAVTNTCQLVMSSALE